MPIPPCDIVPLPLERLRSEVAAANTAVPKDRKKLDLLYEIYRQQWLLIKAHQLTRVILQKGYNQRTLDGLADTLFQLLENDPRIQQENAIRKMTLTRPPKTFTRAEFE